MATDAWNPDQYEKFKAERSQPFYDLMSLLRPRADAEIIDLGCGTGELTAELHRNFDAKRTVGLDLSGEMLKKAAAYANSNLSFQQGDIQTWRSPSSYDIVFSNAALQWCQDHSQLFENIKNSLRPGGQVAIQMPMNHDYPTHMIASQMSYEEPWSSLMNSEKYDKSSTMLTPEDYASLLFRLGFREQSVNLKVYGHVLESRDGVIEWVKGTLLTQFQSRLTEGDFQNFLQEFQQRLFAVLPDEKPFFYPFKRILIWAKI